MTEEQQQLAFAEAGGWYNTTPGVELENALWKSPHDGFRYCTDSLPNSNDLNVLREVRSRFNNSREADTYVRHLVRICRGLVVPADTLVLNTWTIYALINATAAQHREAFLRTVGKWKD